MTDYSNDIVEELWNEDLLRNPSKDYWSPEKHDVRKALLKDHARDVVQKHISDLLKIKESHDAIQIELQNILENVEDFRYRPTKTLCDQDYERLCEIETQIGNLLNGTEELTNRVDRKVVIGALVDNEGKIRNLHYGKLTESACWQEFLKGWKGTLDEAIRAYKAIGYRYKQFNLLEINK